MEFERRRQGMKDINMIALINIIFVLLLFFLVTGTVEKFDIIPIDAPIAKSGRMLEEGPTVILLGRYDEIIVNDEMVAREDLPQVLKERFKSQPNPIITLKPDSALEASKMIAVMDVIKAAGGKNLSLMTQVVD